MESIYQDLDRSLEEAAKDLPYRLLGCGSEHGEVHKMPGWQ